MGARLEIEPLILYGGLNTMGRFATPKRMQRVIYHSLRWELLVEMGWYTMEVTWHEEPAYRIALMGHDRLI